MQDLLLQLVSDIQLYLKDPLHPKGSLLATEEECRKLKQSAHTPALQEKPLKNVVQQSKIQLSTPYTTPPQIIPKKAPTQASALPPSNDRQNKIQHSPKAQPPEEKKLYKPSENSSDIKETLSKIAPGIRFIDQVPDDSEGKKIGSSWKEKIPDVDVVLLACKQDAETIEFLKVLAKAIDTHLAKSKIIPAERLEKENCWDLFLQKNTFRLIVASDGVDQLKNLMRFYRGAPAQNAYFLDQTPLLALLPAAAYKQLDKKAQAWKTLCQILKK